MADSPIVRPNVMVSSTIADLPDHREAILNACLRQGMFPLMMEHEPSSYADPIDFSIDLVNRADIYVGIYANRYGYVPVGQKISLTEMEYDRAVERKIPRLIFMMDKDHPIKIADVETGENALKLKAFKDRAGAENFVNFFKSPSDLRADAINSLSRHRQADLAAFHYVSDIPASPELYVAHPYTLLQSKGLVGRNAELNLLTDWVSKPNTEVFQARVLNVVAIGGMGKSALTWKWFNDIAPQEMKPLAGRVWWSFYESDATFENFVTRALAYVGKRPRHEVEKILPPDREQQLLAILDRGPFLVVLDGLERILIAYARMDAARLSDDDLDESTANRVVGASGLGAGSPQSFVGRHQLRKTADPRVGSFLRRLAAVRASRILVSTRLYPADLQTTTGEPLPGSFGYFLPGLSDDDALGLWRGFKVTGGREDLLHLFHTFDNHPLLIQALAAEVSGFRPAPGDFHKWRTAHPDFDPFNLPLLQVKSHVLSFALRGLKETERKLLHTLAAFRMPSTYHTVTALTVGSGRLFDDEKALDAALSSLEDRGLVGWDRRANRYDLHPVVRGVAWSRLGAETKRGIYSRLQSHFESIPYEVSYVRRRRKGKGMDKRFKKGIRGTTDPTFAIELYNALVGLGYYDEACQVFRDRLEVWFKYGLNAPQQSVELLEMLFPDGVDGPPRLRNPRREAWALRFLGSSYLSNGLPGKAVQFYRRSKAVNKLLKDGSGLFSDLVHLSTVQCVCGALYDAEAGANRALLVSIGNANKAESAVSFENLGVVLAIRGDSAKSTTAFSEANNLIENLSPFYLVRPYVSLAKSALLAEDYEEAEKWAQKAIRRTRKKRFPRIQVRATRLLGAASLGLGNLEGAEENLNRALTLARAGNLVDEELPALVDLADLRRRSGDLRAARELLNDVWELAERGPYPLFHADALNVLAQIERDAGNFTGAAEAANKAYCLAWCDGPPFAYHLGLKTAKKHLAELRVPEPNLPPFDESKFEPMPQARLVPPEEAGLKKTKGRGR